MLDAQGVPAYALVPKALLPMSMYAYIVIYQVQSRAPLDRVNGTDTTHDPPDY